MGNKELCQCVKCKYSRGEVSFDYFKGYLESEIESANNVIQVLKDLGYEETQLTDKESIGKLMSVLSINANSSKFVLEETEKLVQSK